MNKIHLSGIERIMKEGDIIVSKTNDKGHITYANDSFLKMSGYSNKEIINKPHSIIRHPLMPRCVFKLLWDNLKNQKEVFAYVLNLSKNGDHYWVLAHVTPSYDVTGKLAGYHSSRRRPREKAIKLIEPLYKKLLDLESSKKNRKEGMNLSFDALIKLLEEKGVSYDEFILSI